MKTVKNAGIVIKPHARGVERVLAGLLKLLKERGMGRVLETAAAEKAGLPGGVPREELVQRVDLVIVLGGDGTLLSVAHLAAKAGVPVLGVNMGRLGFLTEVPVKELPLTLDAYRSGLKDIVSSRWLLEARCGRQVHLCLNDAGHQQGSSGPNNPRHDLGRRQGSGHGQGRRLDRCHAHGLDGLFAVRGRTHPPAPHSGHRHRPDLPPCSYLSPHGHLLAVAGQGRTPDRRRGGLSDLGWTAGGRLEKNDVVEVRRSKHSLELISSPKRNYFALLREKLGWGE